TRWLGAPGLGKSAVFSAGRRFEPGDLRSSKTGRRDVDLFRSAILGANGQCAGVLLALPGQILLALGSVGILPAPRRVACIGGAGLGGAATGGDSGGAETPPARALFCNRMALVFGHADSCDRPGAGGLAIIGRSVHVPSHDRAVAGGGVGGGRSDQKVECSGSSVIGVGSGSVGPWRHAYLGAGGLLERQ